MAAMLSVHVDRWMLEGQAMDQDKEAIALEDEAAGMTVRQSRAG